MIDSLFNLVFLCSHRNTTFPLTPRPAVSGSSVVPRRRGTYVVCLECGKEFPYNWNELRIEPASAIRGHAPGRGLRDMFAAWLQPLVRLLP